MYDFRDERIGLITHLPKDKEELLSRFENPRPRNIRKAIKEGICISKGQSNSLEFLFNTHLANMNSIGGLAKKREFFDLIPIYMDSNDWMVFTASLNEKPVAALLIFYYNNTVEYFTPVVVETYRNTQALALLIYEAMRDAIDRGYSNWNWGGTWLSQGGVYNFKKKWSTREYAYYYYTKIFNDEIYEVKSNYLISNYYGFFTIPFKHLE